MKRFVSNYELLVDNIRDIIDNHPEYSTVDILGWIDFLVKEKPQAGGGE